MVLSHSHQALDWHGVINLRGCIALILFLGFLKRSVTTNSSHGSMFTTSLHISWVFKLSGTSVKRFDPMYTNHFHETYFLNKSINLFIYHQGPSEGQFFVSGHQTQKVFPYAHNCSVSFFSSSDMRQSHHLDGCKEIAINSFLICAFWALHFLYPSYYSKNLSSQ